AIKINALVLPVLPFGQVWSLKDFPGSINISNDSLISVLVDVGESLHKQGVKKFIFVNGHLGNNTALKQASRVLYESCPKLKVYNLFYPGMYELADEVRESKSAHGSYFHACEIETSYMLYLAPERVDMNKAITEN